MRYALVALGFLATVPAKAEDKLILIGETGKVKVTFVGCIDKDDAYKFKSLVREGDREAAVKFATRKIPNCRAIQKDIIGVVQGNSVWEGSTCLRPKGEPDCYWLPSNFVVAP